MFCAAKCVWMNVYGKRPSEMMASLTTTFSCSNLSVLNKLSACFFATKPIAICTHSYIHKYVCMKMKMKMYVWCRGPLPLPINGFLFVCEYYPRRFLLHIFTTKNHILNINNYSIHVLVMVCMTILYVCNIALDDNT